MGPELGVASLNNPRSVAHPVNRAGYLHIPCAAPAAPSGLHHSATCSVGRVPTTCLLSLRIQPTSSTTSSYVCSYCALGVCTLIGSSTVLSVCMACCPPASAFPVRASFVTLSSAPARCKLRLQLFLPQSLLTFIRLSHASASPQLDHTGGQRRMEHAKRVDGPRRRPRKSFFRKRRFQAKS